MGGSERALRMVPLFAGVLFLFAAWRLAHRVTDPDSARWVVGVLAGAHPMVRFSADLLSDFASAACLLAALTIIVEELKDPSHGPRFRLVGAAPLLAASFYIRYGSCLSIAIIILVSLMAGGRAIARRRMPVVAMLSLFGMLVIPHVIHSMSETRSAAGILLLSGSVPGKAGEGLVTYVSGNVLATYGFVVAPLMIVGVLRGWSDRWLVVLRLIAVAQIIVLGLTTHAQSRFVFLATALLVVCGVQAARRLRTRTTRLRPALNAMATAAIVASWAGGLAAGVWAPRARAASYRPTLLASEAIREDAQGVECEVLGRHTAQLDWYSGCRAVLVVSDDAIFADAPVYAVRRGSDSWDIKSITAASCPVFRALGIVEVVRFRDPARGCAADRD